MKQVRKYRRMRWTDRQKIEALYNAGHTYRSIANELDFSPSAIYYEVKHGLYAHMGAETTKRPYHYSAELGQIHAERGATSKGVPIKLGHRYDYAAEVADAILGGMSPDAVTGRKRRCGEWTVSTSTLYRYIERGYIPGVTVVDLIDRPRRKRKKRKVEKAARPPKGTSIERRPDEVDSRLTFGHWEMDSVIGKAKGQRESLLVFTERYTRYEIIVRVPDKTSKSVVRALDRLIPRFPQGTFQSITVDNGSEFQNCYRMEHTRRGAPRTKVYYCHPFCSCERASNERANGLIRRWFPKGQSLRSVAQRDCDRVASLMNDMPRKILGYATAAELFQAQLAALQLSVSLPK